MTDPSSAAPGADVRSIAVALYRSCLDRKITVEEAVEGDTRARNLPARDRALLANILLTCFRHKGESEAVLNRLLDKPLPRKSGATMDILILGVAQLLFLDMPPHAVIDLSVRAAKEDRNALHFAGVVNAVLRKVAASGSSLLEGVDAGKLNTPGWLWDRWTTAYGGEAARLIGLAHASRPALDISVKDRREHWQEVLGATPVPNGQLRLPADHAPVPELQGFRDGAWWVQDAAATIPVDLLGGSAAERP
jgi:16S rRNA (cytosine967-C5)-methyltransferase